MLRHTTKNKVLHVITGLGNGGAECMLFNLCRASNSFDHVVISLTDLGVYGDRLKAIGITVFALDLPRGKVTFHSLLRLYRLIKIEKPQVIQTWMYHSNLIGGVVAKLCRVKRVFWGVHHSELDSANSSISTIRVSSLCARLSNLVPEKIIYCARKSRYVHELDGYSRKKSVVVQNGYDLERLLPLETAVASPNASSEFADDVIVIGCLARYHACKNHEGLLLAFEQLHRRYPDIRLKLAGPDITSDNVELLKLIQGLKIADVVELKGEVSDVPQFMSTIDIKVLASKTEGFPNVLAEAMACGVPCVSTDVGDAAVIVGDAGWIVEVGSNSEQGLMALISGIEKAITCFKNNIIYWNDIKVQARSHIDKEFSLASMADKYESLWSAEC